MSTNEVWNDAYEAELIAVETELPRARGAYERQRTADRLKHFEDVHARYSALVSRYTGQPL